MRTNDERRAGGVSICIYYFSNYQPMSFLFGGQFRVSNSSSMSLIIKIGTIKRRFLSSLSILSNGYFQRVSRLCPKGVHRYPFRPIIRQARSIFPIPTQRGPSSVGLHLELLSNGRASYFPSAPSSFLIHVSIRIIHSRRRRSFLYIMTIRFTVRSTPLSVFSTVPSMTRVSDSPTFRRFLPSIVNRSPLLRERSTPRIHSKVTRRSSLQFRLHVVFRSLLIPIHPPMHM